MKLKDAMICLNCDEVYPLDQNLNGCPSCGGRFSHMISTWIPTIEAVESAVCRWSQKQGETEAHE